MIRIQPALDESRRTLTVSIPATDTVPASTHSLPYDAPDDAEHITGIAVFKSQADAYVVTPLGHPLQRALSAFLGRSVLLVKKGTELRQAGPPGLVDALHLDVDYDEPNTAFADGFPFLLATVPSLEDLHKRIAAATDAKTREGREASTDAPLSQGRFRANIVVDGDLEPWEEDGWNAIEVGDGVRLYVASRCGRCTVRAASSSVVTRRDTPAQVPEVDPETGIRQPLYPSACLSSFRAVDRYVRALPHPCVVRRICVAYRPRARHASASMSSQSVRPQALSRASLTGRVESAGRINIGDAVKVLSRFPSDGQSGWTRVEETFGD
jgi:hypothetical protein